MFLRCLWRMFKCSYTQVDIVLECYQLLQEFLEVFIKNFGSFWYHFFNVLLCKSRKVKIKTNIQKTKQLFKTLCSTSGQTDKRDHTPFLGVNKPWNLRLCMGPWLAPPPKNNTFQANVLSLLSQAIFRPTWWSALLP